MDDIDLRNIGIDYVGSFMNIRAIRLDHLPVAKTIESEIVHEVCVGKRTRRFRLDQSIYQGAHGVVEAVIVEATAVPVTSIPTTEILFRKVPIDGNSLECEALFQYAAYHVLKKYGLKHTVARVRDIYRDPRVGCAAVFTMVPFLNIKLLSDALENQDFSAADIASIIAQVALIIYILDQELDMNHRDLKTTNVLVADEPGALNVNYKGSTVSIKSGPAVKLVDFGFACAGNGQKTIVNAGNFFPMSDPCPKTGRDLFQLLTTMYLCTRFQKTVDNNPQLSTLFKSWLTVPNNDYIAFLKTIGTQSIDWVYLMLGSDKFFAPACQPIRILHDLSAHFPSVISIVGN